jgi:putative secretion ATPase (PEP-CTERM system associated)
MFETFFGLTSSPFQLNPDPSFLFASKGHRRAHAYLRYGIYQGEGFIVVTGEIGAGKTTLVRALLQELEPERFLIAQLVGQRLDADDLLRAVAIGFGLAADGLPARGELLGAVERFLGGLVGQGRRALLVVDEAQNLTPAALESLRLLSNIQTGQQPVLQTLLVGQPELREMIRDEASESLRQRILASYHLGPLEVDETRSYILHRLTHAGWKGDPAISDGAYALIYSATGGIPRRINSLCKRVLLGAYLAQEHRIDMPNVVAAVEELRAEIGPGAVAAKRPAPASEREAHAAPERPGAAGVHVNGKSSARLAAADAVADKGGNAAEEIRPFMMSAINARLDRLERSTDSMLAMARALSAAARPRPPASSVAAPPKFGPGPVRRPPNRR